MVAWTWWKRFCDTQSRRGTRAKSGFAMLSEFSVTSLSFCFFRGAESLSSDFSLVSARALAADTTRVAQHLLHGGPFGAHSCAGHAAGRYSAQRDGALMREKGTWGFASAKPLTYLSFEGGVGK